MSPDDPRHGQNSGYLAHILAGESACTPCRDAHAEFRRNLWRKKYLRGVDRLYIDATGTIRRIRSLQAIGWRYSDIDDLAGHHGRNWAHNITSQQQVHLDTAQKIDDIYEQLCMTAGPSDRNKRHAARNGWSPPLAWHDIDDPDEQPNLGGTDEAVDQVVVDRLLCGQKVPSTRAEKVEAMRQWRARGGSEKALCDLNGWKAGRYVERPTREEVA